MEKFSRRLVLTAAVALAAMPWSFAQGEKAPDKMTGIAVGEKAPEFNLKDQNGEEVSLSGLLEGSKSVALVFHRSANW